MSTGSWLDFQEPLPKPSGAVKGLGISKVMPGLLDDAAARWPHEYQPCHKAKNVSSQDDAG